MPRQKIDRHRAEGEIFSLTFLLIGLDGFVVWTKPLSRRPEHRSRRSVGGGLASGSQRGGPCDPTTSKDVGRTPTSQLFPRDYPQLHPCCQAVCRIFRQISARTRSRGDTSVSTLPTQRKEVLRRDRQGPHVGAAFSLQESLEAARPILR